MLANKHVIVALLIAPVLSIFAWIAVDQYVGEKPQAALAGKSYPLVAQSNCRYESGQCTLRNQDFSLEVRFANNTFSLTSNAALDGVLFAVGQPDTVPSSMTQGATLKDWRINTLSPLPTDRIYVVAKHQGITFFGDASTAFVGASL